MSYKDLLVVLDAEPATPGRVALAAGFAERFGAHLIGLYPVPVYATPREFGYFDPALLDPLYRELRQQAAEQAEKARHTFEETARRRGISAEWRAVSSGPEGDPAMHARYVDLAIVGQRDPDRGESASLPPRPEHVALASGRPILVAPYAGAFETFGRRVLVAWSATREATRAVNDALPLLAAAETVTVLTIDPRSAPDAHGEIPGADIALHLARHGVTATAERTMAADIPIGETILSRAADLGADLLVMGLYGHSRARELLLGGASRTILDSMTIPVLMSH
jgi:nucleotide-binding universal stress UspA family protein